MRPAIISLLLVIYLGGSLNTVQAQAPVGKARHHVMWTTQDGKTKCRNKGSKDKAELCAAKLRRNTVTGVQVMEGKCMK